MSSDGSDASGEETPIDGQQEDEWQNIDDVVQDRRAEYIIKLGDEEWQYEAPIDLNISKMTRIELNPLMWYNHDIVPKKMKITNTGYTVILSAKWQRERPYLIDGPFTGKYVFSQLHFHWGKNEMVGSEHYLDGCCMPMELHAVHFKADYLSQEAASREKDGLAILVYLFRLLPSPNPTLVSLVDGLSRIQEAGTSTRLSTSEALVNWTRPFAGDYFLYWGALNHGGEKQRVLWLVSREPIGIAQEQVARFRTLYDVNNQPLLQNCHKLQDRCGRSLFHVNPSGKCSYSLLPVPREPPPLTANQIVDMIENFQVPDL
ncbi:hypothetical protein QAD02_010031 [Eretmocerus hayati]|uniref:Uncharacterized protein n=1 Tax=Eretmocerus hayati TaxID=131215 RepID=A0ACC2NBQ4_9HYME|nr:hypothetical protein QAD02_010031 [Eretmocerus hayati]